MAAKHRYVIIGDALWRITPDNYRRALETARQMNSRDIELDRKQFRMVQVDDRKPPDWTTLSSAEAEALLLGLDADAATKVEQEQADIENQTAEEEMEMDEDEDEDEGPTAA